MLITTNQELRLHNPSSAIDDINILQGIIDNSEKDFLREKLGYQLYDKLCQHYKSITPESFYTEVISGEELSPYNKLLLQAQRVIVNDALVRYAYQHAVSINSTGVNMASSEDYSVVNEKMLDKAVQGYKMESFSALNAMLVMLELWAKDDSILNEEQSSSNAINTEIREIVTLWKQSRYYYRNSSLLIPTCSVLQQYIDIYDNRDKFIRLLPEILFIQEEYIEDIVGSEVIEKLLSSDDNDRLLKKVRRLIVTLLEERTTIIPIDKARRQQAHSESISLKSSILSIVNKLNKPESELVEVASDASAKDDSSYKNNKKGTRMFVTPMLY